MPRRAKRSRPFSVQPASHGGREKKDAGDSERGREYSMLEGHRGTFPGENRSHHIHGKSRDHGGKRRRSSDTPQILRRTFREPCPKLPRSAALRGGRERPQKRGRLAGIPSRRGNRCAQGTSCVATKNRNPPAVRTSPARPKVARPTGSHRERSSGGSLTTSRPPVANRGAAHSAVTAGGPKPRATTASKRPRRGGTSSSARPHTTSARCAASSSATALRRVAMRR